MTQPSAPAGRQPTEADEAFELVRQSFLARLRGELARLHVLAKQLQANQDDCSPLLNTIATFAHRLRGAAAVFYELELSDAARALELAALAASSEEGHGGDARLWLTVRTLKRLLAHIIDSVATSRLQEADPAQPASAA